jgi:hypothetical protein
MYEQAVTSIERAIAEHKEWSAQCAIEGRNEVIDLALFSVTEVEAILAYAIAALRQGRVSDDAVHDANAHHRSTASAIQNGSMADRRRSIYGLQ